MRSLLHNVRKKMLPGHISSSIYTETILSKSRNQGGANSKLARVHDDRY